MRTLPVPAVVARANPRALRALVPRGHAPAERGPCAHPGGEGGRPRLPRGLRRRGTAGRARRGQGRRRPYRLRQGRGAGLDELSTPGTGRAPWRHHGSAGHRPFWPAMEKSLQRALDLNHGIRLRATPTSRTPSCPWAARTRPSASRSARCPSIPAAPTITWCSRAILAEQSKPAEADDGGPARGGPGPVRPGEGERAQDSRIRDKARIRPGAAGGGERCRIAAGRGPGCPERVRFHGREASACTKLVPCSSVTAPRATAAPAAGWPGIRRIGHGRIRGCRQGRGPLSAVVRQGRPDRTARASPGSRPAARASPKDEAAGHGDPRPRLRRRPARERHPVGGPSRRQAEPEGMARARELLKKACDGGDAEACRLFVVDAAVNPA